MLLQDRYFLRMIEGVADHDLVGTPFGERRDEIRSDKSRAPCNDNHVRPIPMHGPLP